jgi:hypothetical protein
MRTVACISVGAIGLAASVCAGAVGDLYVSSDFSNTTMRYNGVTGALTAPFASSFAATGQLGFHHSTAANRALIGHFGGGVEEFDLTTGAYIKTYGAGGGTTWAGVYAPNGNVLVGDWTNNDVREYNSVTGALVGIFNPNIPFPADMQYGPNGNLYVAAFNTQQVFELNPINGSIVSSWSTPFGTRPNDIAFMPDGRIIVTTMDFTNGPGPGNMAWVYDAGQNLIANFAGTGWGRVHGVDVNPADGNIYIADGITAQVHVFDGTTYTELNSMFLTPHPIGKIVDLEFQRVPTPGAMLVLVGGALLGARRRR